MKLRNKKTGEAVYVDFQIPLSNNEKVVGVYSVTSLKALNESFEDYEPKEPVIKDEKIRKAVRAWAEANDLKNVAFEDYDDENVYFIDRDYEPQIWFSKKSILESPLDDGKIYTIAELCGEIDCEPVKEMEGWRTNE